jgi:hypothetical protein
MNERSIETEMAMNVFYNSKTFDKLNDKETGLYLNGSSYVYEIFKEEYSG